MRTELRPALARNRTILYPHRLAGAPLRVRVSSTYLEEAIPTMKGETGELWQTLCSQAAQEQDPDCLMELCQINEILGGKEERLRGERKDPGNNSFFRLLSPVHLFVGEGFAFCQ